MPLWMARFRSVDTTKGNLFNEYEADIWPPVCGECHANLLDPNAPRCGLCQPQTGQQPANAEDGHDVARRADSGKRTRFADTDQGAGSARTATHKLLVKRNDFRDIRELDHARARGEDDKSVRSTPLGDRQATRERQPRREVDARSALARP